MNSLRSPLTRYGPRFLTTRKGKRLNNYRFQIEPYTGPVKALCEIKSYDFSINDESDTEEGVSDNHILESPHLNSVSDIELLKRKIKGFLMLFNGALIAVHGFEKAKNRYGYISIANSEGVNYSDISSFKDLDTVQINPFSFDLINPLHPEADKLSTIINMSSKYEDIRTIVAMCSIGSDWVNLYRIFETTVAYTMDFMHKNTELHGIKIGKKNHSCLASELFGLDEINLSRFTGTVNSFELIGFLSRHGKSYKTRKTMPNPMTRLDATIFINEFVMKFINFRLMLINKNIPFIK